VPSPERPHRILDPGGDAIVSEIGQAPRVSIARGRQHDTDSWRIGWRHAAPAQNDVDERSPGPGIAIRRKGESFRIEGMALRSLNERAESRH